MSDARLIQEGIDDLAPMQGRSSGLHVSNIIRSLCIKLGHFNADGSFGDKQSLFELGNSFEDALIATLRRRYETFDGERFVIVGQLELNDIYGTPDLFDAIDSVLIEIKLTWMSARHDWDSEKFWKYWVQLMAYCRMMDVSIGRLHVCFINGDYGKTTRGPIYRVWERKFDDDELWENWRMLQTHGEALEDECEES